eukprot:CAMPEP_0115008128 /NCGR_PEP_ID=MMETSP0216-20121206/21694_1 /TAXON_ID=223996 /ORGANISM="Protocruzia adherens, Strain Boccale" /LENGTH=677 /DNA_ID=CAMNT_0002375409 /DNA_START=238 /DNA_END=2271 /DNA_ORIENTATION=+
MSESIRYDDNLEESKTDEDIYTPYQPYLEAQSHFKSRKGKKDYLPVNVNDIEMDDLNLTRDISMEKWDAIPDLDAFFTTVYQYYRFRGFKCAILYRLVDILSLSFTLGFCVLILCYINWTDILQCRDERSCDGINIFIDQPFKEFGLYHAFILYSILIFIVYLVWHVYCYAIFVREMIEMRSLFIDRLRIRDDDLFSLKWSDIVDRLAEMQKKYRYCIVKDELTALDIASRIMRKENYLVAMVNSGVLKTKIKLPYLGEKRVFTKAVEWNINIILLNSLFGKDKFHLDRSFYSVKTLKARFVFAGVVNLLILLPMVVFCTLFYFFRHTEEFKRNNDLGAKEWSNYMLWKYREFNELPHIFEQRMRDSCKPAEQYIRSFPNMLRVIMARFVSYIAGSFLALLIVLSFYDDALALYLRVYDKNLLWYMAILGAVIGVARLFGTEEPAASRIQSFKARWTKSKTLQFSQKSEVESTLENLVSHVHSLPKKWKNDPFSRETLNRFSQHFRSKIWHAFDEMIGMLATPFLLIFKLPNQAEELIEYIMEHTQDVKGTGDVCLYSLLDLLHHGNPDYGFSSGNLKCTNYGKLEKSWISFLLNYENWDPIDDEGMKLISRAYQYREKKNQTMKSELQMSYENLRFSAVMEKPKVPQNLCEDMEEFDINRNPQCLFQLIDEFAEQC